MGQALRNIGIVSGMTMASRVLGLVRDMSITATFGATALTSAFLTAFTLPNLFRRLLGEGALTAALVPTLQDETKQRGPAGALELVNEVATWTLLASSLITGLAMLLFAANGWWAPRIEATGWFEPATVARWVLGAKLGVVLFPYLVTVCLAAVFSAALQTNGRFLEPALNPVWLNLSMLGLLGYGAWTGAAGDRMGRMHWLCAGVLLGGVLQMVVPALTLARLGWRPRFAPARSEGVRRIARLMLPTLFGSAIYLVNTAVSRLLGLSLDDAAVTVLNQSTRLMELPIGVFALAVSTVVFPQIAKHVAEMRLDLLAEDYRKGMRLILLVNVPAAFGLAILAEPITRVLFQRGAFTAADTAIMAPVLGASALALPFLAFVSLTLRAFYAFKDTRTPVRVAFLSFLVNIGASLLLMRWLGVAGLAAGSTLAVVVQAVCLQVKLARRHAGLEFRHLSLHLGKVTLASLLMTVVVAGIWHGWTRFVGIGGWRDIVGLTAGVAAGVGVFGLVAAGLKVEGLAEALALARKKLKLG